MTDKKSPSSSDRPDGIGVYDQQIRVALVMYGGVSLAVYINGVSQEFFHAVRGTGVYGFLKCLRQSEIVVDIISGSSAGGINGVLLGCALASSKGRNFEASSALWRDRGGIEALLFRPGTADPPSVFDGDGYYLEQLRECFEELVRSDGWTEPRPGATRLVSPVPALDVFVTGTDYHGQKWKWADALGEWIDVKDHRATFRLKYRRGRKEDGDDLKNARALSKLARITSSFPGALAPVRIGPPAQGGNASDEEKVDTSLRRWGHLRPGTAWFIDGGVLDNKPFTQTIEQIYYRVADAPVDRKLFFVEPDPEQASKETGGDMPDILGVMTRSLGTLPRYESIASDLRDIARHNERVAQALAFFRQRPWASSGNRVAGAIEQRIYQGCRCRWLSERVRVALIERTGSGGEPAPAEKIAIGVPAAWVPRIDVEFSLRRLFHVTYGIYDAIYPPDGSRPDISREAIAEIRRLLYALNRHVQLVKLAERVVEDALTGAASRLSSAPDLSSQVHTLLGSVLALDREAETLLDREPIGGDSYLSEDAIGEVRSRLRTQIQTAVDKGWSLALSPTAPGNTLLSWEKRQAEHLWVWARGRADNVLRPWADDYHNFDQVDVQVRTFDLAVGVREKDPIEAIRVSSSDAQLGFSRRSPRQKVSGDTLGHFGGFFKASWRANDILWGRLDGRCQLVRALLDKKKLAAALAADTSTILTDLEAFAGVEATRVIDRLFPLAHPEDRTRVQTWLDDLLGARRNEALDELDGRGQGSLPDVLVRVAQSDIVASGVEDVVLDARNEARSWNADEFAAPLDLDAVQSEDPRSFAEECARDRSRFEKSYRVGDERLTRNIPPRILLGLFAHGALIFRDAVFSAADRRVTRKRMGWLVARPLAFTRRVLGWPLQVAYWYATITRARPIRIGAVFAALLLLAVLGIVGRSVLGQLDDETQQWQLRWLNTIVFAIAPVSVLALEVAFFMLSHGRLGRLIMFTFLLGVVGFTIWIGLQADAYTGLVSWWQYLRDEHLLYLVAIPSLGTLLLILALSRTTTGAAVEETSAQQADRAEERKKEQTAHMTARIRKVRRRALGVLRERRRLQKKIEELRG